MPFLINQFYKILDTINYKSIFLVFFKYILKYHTIIEFDYKILGITFVK